jgi:hypothetical protein
VEPEGVTLGVPFGKQGGHALGEEVIERGSFLQHRAPPGGAVLEQIQRLAR